MGRAHYKAGDLFLSRHHRIGFPTIILSAIVGTAVFSTLQSQERFLGLRIATGLLSITAAVFAALQTVYNYSELASKHRDIGGAYSVIRRKLDLFILKWKVADNSQGNQAVEELRLLSEELSVIAKTGLHIPPTAWTKAKNEIKKLQEEDIKTSVRYISENQK
jgi:hypothetical protein